MSFRRRKSAVINRTLYQDNKVNYLMSPHSYTEAPVLSFGRENPPGSIIAYTMQTAPIGWLVCDGSAVNRVIYAALFSVIGTTFGAGDEQFTFNLPDYRGAFLRGSGTSNGFSGPNVNVSQTDAIRSHTHSATVNDTGHAHTQTSSNDDFNNNSGAYPSGSGVNPNPSYAQYDSGTRTWTNTINSNLTGITVTIGNTGSTETRPYNYGVVWLIKY